jgi:anti-anti-sigma factor
MSASSPLRPPGGIRLRTEGGRCVLELCGEVDTAVATAFQADAGVLLQHPPLIDVVDTADVTFLNSVGMRLLLRLTEPARAAGRRPQLRRPSRATLQLLRLTHLDELFDIAD